MVDESVAKFFTYAARLQSKYAFSRLRSIILDEVASVSDAMFYFYFPCDELLARIKVTCT